MLLPLILILTLAVGVVSQTGCTSSDGQRLHQARRLAEKQGQVLRTHKDWACAITTDGSKPQVCTDDTDD